MPQPTRPRPPSPSPSPPGTATHHNALIEAINKLRAAMATMHPGGGGGVAGAGQFGALDAGAFAPLQGLAASIKRTVDQTAADFAASMARTQQAWRAGLGNAQGAWSASVDTFRTNFATASSGVAAGFERAFDASIGRGIDLFGRGFTASARAAHRAFANPAAMLDPFRATWGFGGDFVSGWRHAARGGIPVGGVGATWGQAAGLAWQDFSYGARNVAGVGINNLAALVGTTRARARHAWRGFRRGARYARIRASRAYSQTRSVGAAARAGATAFAGRGLTGLATKAIPVVGQALAAYQAFGNMVESMRDQAERAAAGNRQWSRFNGAIAATYQMSDLHDLRRSYSFARQTQGSTITLARAVDQMRDDWQGYDVFKAEVKNRASGFFAGFSGQMGKDYSATVAPITAKMHQVDPNGLVSTGVGAGFAAGINALPGEVARAAWDNPLLALATLGIAPLYMGIRGAQQKAADVADAKVTALANPQIQENQVGRALHALTKPLTAPGPFIKRPAPIH